MLFPASCISSLMIEKSDSCFAIRQCLTVAIRSQTSVLRSLPASRSAPSLYHIGMAIPTAIPECSILICVLDTFLKYARAFTYIAQWFILSPCELACPTSRSRSILHFGGTEVPCSQYIHYFLPVCVLSTTVTLTRFKRKRKEERLAPAKSVG